MNNPHSAFQNHGKQAGREQALLLLREIAGRYQAILQEKLTGIYVHGSLAFGCFYWGKSDLDFLVVTNAAPSLAEKEQLIRILLQTDGRLPPKGAEMSVVQAKYCKPFQYPTPFDLHFSNTHKAACVQDFKNYCFHMNGTDPDLAAHATVIQKAGFPLCGKPVARVFAPVPEQNYWDSITKDIQNAVAEIAGNPLYITLNLCRVAAYAKERAVLSKEQGGFWGLSHFPGDYRPILLKALACYGSEKPFEESPQALQRFATFALAQIFSSPPVFQPDSHCNPR